MKSIALSELPSLLRIRVQNLMKRLGLKLIQISSYNNGAAINAYLVGKDGIVTIIQYLSGEIAVVHITVGEIENLHFKI